MNKEGLRKLNQKNGHFNLILNRVKENKYFINAENKEEFPNITNFSNKLKSSFNNNNENNESQTNLKKKKLLMKIGRGFSIENSHLNNYKSPIKKQIIIFFL